MKKENKQRGSDHEQRLQAIIESAIDGIITIDDQGIIDSFNKAGAALFGYSQEELIGQDIKLLMSLPDSSNHQRYVDRYVETGERKIIGIGREVRGLKKDGTTFPFRLAVSELWLSGKRSFLGIIHDLSKEREARQKQKEYASELEEKNKELENFAYICSHDLKEPLRKIVAFGDRLETADGRNLSEKGLDSLHRIQASARRMQELIDDLLKLSRVDTLSQDIPPVNLNEILKQTLADLELKIEQSGVEIIASGLPEIEADPIQIRQLLQNLIGNAIKFQDGNEKPVVEIFSRMTSEGEDPNREMANIYIRDNGIGIAPEYMDKIFEIFLQLNGRHFGGSGMGLTICKKIAQRHGGVIHVHSTPGEGSTFIVSLPLKQETDSQH